MFGELTSQSFEEAIGALIDRDRDLASVVARHGPPGIMRRESGYATLVLLILEQQVSLASAKATFERLSATAGDLTPEILSALSDEQFRGAGVSRQKTRYIRCLGQCVLDETLSLERLAIAGDDEVRERLTSITGIGPWTADIYLLTCLMRPDIWPVGDIALQAAVRDVKRLEHRPDRDTLDAMGEQWRPWRSVATRIFWHYYLSTVRRAGQGGEQGPAND